MVLLALGKHESGLPPAHFCYARHWADLEARHRAILDVIGWISPELLELATALDRFSSIRRDGLMPWLEKIKAHWPHPDVPPAGPAA